ncbi:hypothetical protein [Desulfosediminicola flagellatus]|uniref:hypothetical protein n=1 Tax=Desulfosediminicola flagellatus TaxID=2569541 RepID=UPI0010AB6CDC|nr:hypothetical protein [Desulfosediminicola flagellatus]
MADIHNLDDQRKKDKLTAHIALGAEESEEVLGDCLNPEQLTDIAVGDCTPEEKARALAHFGTCKKCYDAWVAISFSIAAVHRGTNRPASSFGSVRNLTFLGSAFAIAASVMVFLNIKDEPMVQQVAAPPAIERKAVGDNVAGEVGADAEPVQAKKIENALAPPVPAMTQPSAAAKAKARRQSEPTRVLMHADAENTAQKRSPDMAAEVQAVAGTTAYTENESLQLGETVSIAQWLAKVKEACLVADQKTDQPAALYWQSLSDQGVHLDMREIPASMQDRIKRITVLLAAAEQTGSDQHCRSILALLAEDGVTE